jgi:thiamine biosynthesis lipoprotein
MAAENELQIHCPDAALARAAAARAMEEVARIEVKYSRYRPESLLSQINANAGGDFIGIDAETEGLLDYADACFRQSGGVFDPTSGVLRRAWNFETQRTPSEEELAQVLPLVGWKGVERRRGGVRLARPGMQLDFGGFGKEYAVDRAALALREAGIASAIVNLAGDVCVLGPHPDGKPWQVGIRHPRRKHDFVATVPVSSGALATSGDYERFMEVDGVRHCHVLDPRTGRSARGFQSVSVLAPTCLVAGSATTIAMLKGREAGLAWLQSLGLPYLCVYEDGGVQSKGWGDSTA